MFAASSRGSIEDRVDRHRPVAKKKAAGIRDGFEGLLATKNPRRKRAMFIAAEFESNLAPLGAQCPDISLLKER